MRAVLRLRAMRKSDFYFDLPPGLIAQSPPEHRGDSRLLHLDASGLCHDLQFRDLPKLLRADDLLVFNDTRVVPARFLGRKPSGGQVEVLVERVLTDRSALVHIRSSKPCRPDSELVLEKDIVIRVIGREGPLYLIELMTGDNLMQVMEEHGRIPLPPYIVRPANADDRSRYQTVYARQPGAVAAPTAGLHFDQSMLDQLQGCGVNFGWLTLHVGAGTFQPLRTEDVLEHKMHSERIEIGESLVAQINTTRKTGGRIIAVGTTVVRSLESVAGEDGTVSVYKGETDIFITPGYRFRVVDAILTNFHLPESTLLMLVSAFAGRDRIIGAYKHAVSEKYRFFSYGDAMFIESPTANRNPTRS